MGASWLTGAAGVAFAHRTGVERPPGPRPLATAAVHASCSKTPGAIRSSRLPPLRLCSCFVSRVAWMSELALPAVASTIAEAVRVTTSPRWDQGWMLKTYPRLA